MSYFVFRVNLREVTMGVIDEEKIGSPSIKIPNKGPVLPDHEQLRDGAGEMEPHLK